MKALIDEFKAFILKGNVIDLAVGIIIGAAFKTVVDSMVGDIITPVVKVVTGKANYHAVLGGFGAFVGSVLNFLLLAAVIFFVFVKPMNKLVSVMMRKKEEEKPAEPAADVKLLTEIRDLLKK
jgi:large conductance mechanosensitive channel